MKRKFAIPIVLTASVVTSSAAMPASDPASSCLGGRREALLQGHFSGPLVCSGTDASFTFVGHTAGRKFSIYDYRYRYLPDGGNVMHGGQKIIVFRGNAYAGQYALSPPPYAAISLRGSQIALQLAGSQKRTVLDLSRELPRQIFFNGDVAPFYR